MDRMCCHVHFASGKLIIFRSVICEGFMTSHIINVSNRQNAIVFTQLEAKIITQAA